MPISLGMAWLTESVSWLTSIHTQSYTTVKVSLLFGAPGSFFTPVKGHRYTLRQGINNSKGILNKVDNKSGRERVKRLKNWKAIIEKCTKEESRFRCWRRGAGDKSTNNIYHNVLYGVTRKAAIVQLGIQPLLLPENSSIENFQETLLKHTWTKWPVSATLFIIS